MSTFPNMTYNRLAWTLDHPEELNEEQVDQVLKDIINITEPSLSHAPPLLSWSPNLMVCTGSAWTSK